MSVRSHRGPGSNARTQRERILAELRRRRETSWPWITGKDFREPACDDGPEVANITPRVAELGKVHHIISERGDDGCARYRLAWDLGDEGVPIKRLVADAREAARSTGETADEPRLFEPEPAPAPTITKPGYADWDAAA